MIIASSRFANIERKAQRHDGYEPPSILSLFLTIISKSDRKEVLIQ